ncbi:MAG: tetratricopeptide repeat protein [Sulfuricurvum sp.]|uniref:tetratricopeptide repeat protein n=1 Tax=Sulfuricurvum sp. TaxID=2025608 RepID=UPI0025DA6056|nr:tetratricopeptide repeat protein [Sulfuricurvum sp.]MBV5320853.1 tetratricopeptide repeat protein [Sulfuricurvum sp.]
MAEDQEEIIIIEESDAAGVEKKADAAEVPSDEKPSLLKNKKLIIGAGVLVLLLLGGGGMVFFFSGHGDENAVAVEEGVAKAAPEEEIIEPSQLENMIERANYLYANGNATEALKLYEKIALYSEAISQYNLGVVQLKEGEYESALSNFKRSIANSENRCVSAINAAVCCLNLKREKDFNYYIKMADTYLPQESNSPMYSYYYSLINYYKGNYLEALSALKHPTTEEYQTTQNTLRSKISAMFGSFTDAISALENPPQEEDSFSLGLLYANLGNIEKATKYLNDAIMQNDKPTQEQLALAYVHLKAGLHSDASKLIQTATNSDKELVYSPYPIHVFLKPSLYNPDDLQRIYRERKEDNRQKIYQNIFYFAPYKIFNADQTLSYIRKGNANIFIDDITSAKEYLQTSTRASSVDYGIALSVQKALKFRLRDANQQLLALLKRNPQHSILHYDLALTYAQLGDIAKAHEHFLRSYHLDANNYMSGLFAIMCGDMLGKDSAKLSSILKDNLAQEPEKEEFELYRTLFDITQNNIPSSSKWLDKAYKERPLYLALDVAIATEMNQKEDARKFAKRLSALQPNNILPHLMVIDTHFGDQKPKAFAASAINYLKKQSFHYDDLYFGPQITRDKAILMSAMTGQLSPFISRLETRLQITTDHTADIIGALAQSYFYHQEFEKSYTLYNQLIDTYKIRDEKTLFMGASASIGAEHYENAIALLELSKIQNPSYLDTRYALALLYMQSRNNQAAIIQLDKMGNTGFKSQNFDFEIDTEKLANEPHLYHPL